MKREDGSIPLAVLLVFPSFLKTDVFNAKKATETLHTLDNVNYVLHRDAQGMVMMLLLATEEHGFHAFFSV